LGVKKIEAKDWLDVLLSPVTEKPKSPNSFFMKWSVNVTTIENEKVIDQDLLRTEEISVDISLPNLYSVIYPKIAQFINNYEKRSWNFKHDLDFMFMEEELFWIPRPKQCIPIDPEELIYPEMTFSFLSPLEIITDECEENIVTIFKREKGCGYDLDKITFG